MIERSTTMINRLRQTELPGLDLGNNMIYPAYGGQSILNIPASICHWFNVPPLHTQPLVPEILEFPQQRDFRQVILILMDALALHRLQRWLDSGSIPVWARLADKGILVPLTSIVPSTTSSALTSLWTGRSPNEHGILGYELWLKEYSVIANTILHTPVTFRGTPGLLEKAGFDPYTYLPWPTLGTHLAAHQVKSYAFQHFGITESGLSRMFLKDVDLRGFNTTTDLWINLRHLAEQNLYERRFIWVYWGTVDNFSHIYGPDDERVAAEFAVFSAQMDQLFLQKLSPAARQKTLLLLTSDHGQINTPQNPFYELRNHPELLRTLHMLPSGENRLAYFFVRPGHIKAVQEYLEHTWPGQFSILESAYAAKCGLFGPGDPHSRLFERYGDLLVVPQDNAYLWWDNKDNHLLGRHGGLHPDEMLVPFLGVEL